MHKAYRDVAKGIKKLWFLFALSLALIAPVASVFSEVTKPFQSIYTVTRAVDGDTLLLDNGERVRLIGVDTPETVHPHKPVEPLGVKASAFAKREIEGEKVQLEYDPVNARINHKDKYGRTLAYVYRVSDDFFLNAELIKQGFSSAYTRFPFKYKDKFLALEREVREYGIGEVKI